MSNERLWAPWRLGFIKGTAEVPTGDQRQKQWWAGADQSCFICLALADGVGEERASADRENLVDHRGPQSPVMLNRFPYNNGHLLISPNRHLATLAELTDDVQLELLQSITRLTKILETLVNAHGFNVGLNLGRAAGAGVPGHLHWHLVPRWPGDVNFMPVTAGVQILPQSLEQLWELLTAELARPAASG